MAQQRSCAFLSPYQTNCSLLSPSRERSHLLDEFPTRFLRPLTMMNGLYKGAALL